MRPEILYPLFAPLTSLKGVGNRYGKIISDLCGERVIDLLWHLPVSVIDRSNKTTVRQAVSGQIATLKVRVTKHIPPHNPKSPYRVVCSDDTSDITLVFFKVYKDYIVKNLPLGEVRVISGKVEDFSGVKQMTHPDYIVSLDKLDTLPLQEPIYPLCAGLSQKILQKSINEALSLVPVLPEWLDNHFLKQEQWSDFNTSLLRAHHLETEGEANPLISYRRRLAYDELLAGQLALAISRKTQRKLAGFAIKGDKHIRNKVFKALPFALTDSQIQVLREIGADMESGERMLRLLQGDVGSGKTIVAFFALLNAVEAGFQGAFMAPTDILARQHFAKLKPLADLAGVKIALLTGKDKPKDKQAVAAALQSGEIDIIIGTHTLFQDKVHFKNLGLGVIDEQHKFGVHQRLALSDKGQAPDVLVMTATPIPRTLALTVYGDMDISYLTEKPAGRKPVKTAVLPNTKIKEVIASVARALQQGDKIYWVCPLVEESEVLDLTAATDRFAKLDAVFKGKVGLVHGKMKQEEKDEIMAKFADVNSDIKILVATTVIEVGVDIPQANIMIIEHAERFGLAGLHQLRGRVGRGGKESVCLLLYEPPLSPAALSRLSVMRETEDGFRIAEEDLKTRGFGEVLGTKQSGYPEFKLVRFPEHEDLLRTAAKDAKLILNKDTDLTSLRGQALRILLYLFGMDEGIKTLSSG